MVYGFVISAGNETRFSSNTPKALSEINGTPILKINCDRLSRVCDFVYVVVSKSNKHFFDGYNIIEIDSGYGCGDAVWKALSAFDFAESDACIIQWGDCMPEEGMHERLIEEFRASGCDLLIPVESEDSPYVDVEVDDGMNVTKILFSKYGEVHGRGLHDLSVFCVNPEKTKSYMEEFHRNHWGLGGYSSEHGDEFQFLDLVNDTGIHAKALVFEGYKNFAFNTVSEFMDLVGGIGK